MTIYKMDLAAFSLVFQKEHILIVNDFFVNFNFIIRFVTPNIVNFNLKLQRIDFHKNLEC